MAGSKFSIRESRNDPKIRFYFLFAMLCSCNTIEMKPLEAGLHFK